jgi:hypothetical protein
MSFASQIGYPGAPDVPDYSDPLEENLRRQQALFAKRIADPFSRGLGGLGLPAQDQPKYPPIPEPEVQSLTGKLLGAGGSLLGFIGGTLDKLGPRQIRALASGHLEDIPQSLVPFGGTLGLENPEHNLTWDQILTGKGRVLPKLIPENDPTKYEWRDLVPLLFDVAATPGLPALGPLTKAGKLAEMTGTLPRTLAQQVRGFSQLTPEVEAAIKAPTIASQAWRAPVAAPEGFLAKAAAEGLPEAQAVGAPLRAGVKLSMFPFGTGPSLTLGGGPRTQSAADFLTSLSQNLQFSPTLLGRKNPVPILRNLFDWKTGNALDPELQFSNITKAVPVREGIESQSRAHEFAVRSAMEKAAQDFGLQGSGSKEAVANYIRDRIEGVWAAKNPEDWVQERLLPSRGTITDIADKQSLAEGIKQAAPALNEIANMMKGGVEYVKSRSLERGYPFKDYSDQYLDYFTRQSMAPGGAAGVTPKFQSIGRQIWGGQTPSQTKRMDVFRDVPGGTSLLSQLSTDPKLVGPRKLQGQAASDYLRNILEPEAISQMTGRKAPGSIVGRLPFVGTPEQVALEAKYPTLATRLGKLSPIRLTPEGSPLFNVDPVTDLMTRYSRFGKSAGATEAAYDLLQRQARPTLAGDMSAWDVARKLGLSKQDELLRAVERDQGFVNQATGQVFKADDIINAVPGAPSLREALSQYGLPESQAKEMFAAQTKYLTPHELGPVVGGWHDLQNLFKSMVYGVFPASHVRNYMGGMYNNWVRGAFDPRFSGYGPRDWFGLRRYVQPQLDIRTLLRGGEVEGLGREELLKNLYAGKALGQSGIYSDIAPKATQRFADEGITRAIAGEPVTPTIAKSVRSGFEPYGRALLGQRPKQGWRSLLPWAQKEVSPGQWESINPLVQAGEAVSRTTENQLRAGQALAYMRQGYSPEAAAARTMQTQFNYEQLAPFEQKVMKSLFPFYTFTRKNIPYQFSQLFENPNKAGQTIRIFDALRGGQYVPNYMSSEFGFPVGPEGPTGERRYLSKTGLPIEEAFSRFHPGSLKNTALEFFGMMNPYIKGGLEQLFGKQAYTQRDLDELHPSGVATGFGAVQGPAAQVLSQIVANSPATRLASTIDMLSDPRKGLPTKLLNLGTGFKLSDVNVEAARLSEARKALEAMMVGNPVLRSVKDFYIPSDQFQQVAATNPQAVELMRLYQALGKQAQTAKQARLALEANQGF